MVWWPLWQVGKNSINHFHRPPGVKPSWKTKVTTNVHIYLLLSLFSQPPIIRGVLPNLAKALHQELAPASSPNESLKIPKIDFSKGASLWWPLLTLASTHTPVRWPPKPPSWSSSWSMGNHFSEFLCISQHWPQQKGTYLCIFRLVLDKKLKVDTSSVIIMSLVLLIGCGVFLWQPTVIGSLYQIFLFFSIQAGKSIRFGDCQDKEFLKVGPRIWVTI